MEIVMLIVGVIFAGLGGYMLRDEISFRRQATHHIGHVVAIETQRGSKGSTMYAPVIRYEHQGEAQQFTARISSSHCSYDIGDKVDILIATEHSPPARLKGLGMLIVSSLFFAIGLGCTIGFFFIFQFDALSLIIASVVLFGLLTQLIFALKKRHIYSLDDLKREIDKAKKMNDEPADKRHHKETTHITDKETLRRKKHKTTPIGLGIILLLVGITATGGGIHLGLDRWQFIQNASTAVGKVVDFESTTTTSDGTTSTTYAPIIQFTPANSNVTIKFTDDFGSSSPSEQAGDKVPVLYLADEPSEAIMDKGWLNWFAPGLLSIIGIFFTLIGIRIIKSYRKQKKAESAVELDY